MNKKNIIIIVSVVLFVPIIWMSDILSPKQNAKVEESQIEAQSETIEEPTGDVGSPAPEQVNNVDKQEIGLSKKDIIIGSGASAKRGGTVSIHYTGFVSGKKFDSSYDLKAPFAFKIGAGNTIKGLEVGVVGMKVGGKRKIIVPSRLAYGEKGASNIIPPNADLEFDIELINVK